VDDRAPPQRLEELQEMLARAVAGYETLVVPVLAAQQRRRSDLVADYRGRLASPYIAASLGFIDDVIAPHQTRPRVIAALRALRGKRVVGPARKHGNIPL